MSKFAALAHIVLGTVIPSHLSNDPLPDTIWPVWKADDKFLYPAYISEQNCMFEVL